VQPHHHLKDNKPIVDYDSNNDFEHFDDFAPSPPEEGLMEDYTNGRRQDAMISCRQLSYVPTIDHVSNKQYTICFV
jgi:hypothetical protein